MESEQSGQLEYILGRMAVGVAILDCLDLRIRYINPYFLSLLENPWRSQGALGRSLSDILPPEVQAIALPILQQVCSTGQSSHFSEVPYEGFLKQRGRTYWHVSIEPAAGFISSPPADAQQAAKEPQRACDALFVTIEDQTSLVRSRLHIKAIHNVTSAIVGPFALPLVLDRILQAVQEMVGSTRCAVLLIDVHDQDNEALVPAFEKQARTEQVQQPGAHQTISIAAQRGMHIRSQDWHPQVSERLLVGRIMRSRRTLVVEDASTEPEIDFPLLDDAGIPRRPGSVLCVPIFEPTSEDKRAEDRIINGNGFYSISPTGPVLGTIEVYHRRARGFPAEEVELLEQFAQQAGLAIQNARLFRSINHLAQVANRNARERENIMQSIPDGVIIYDTHWRVVDANHAARKLLGWSDNVIGLHVSKALAHSRAIFQHDLASIPDIVAELERGAMAKRVSELKISGADGQQYTMRRSQAPIHDASGNIFAFVVIYHDVTEQAAARERIEAEVIARTTELAQRNLALQNAKAAQEMANARMQLLLERLPSGVMLVSADDKRITIINRLGVLLLQRMGWVPTSAGLNGSKTEEYHGPSTGITPALASSEDGEIATRLAIGVNIEELLRSLTLYGSSGSVVPYEEHPLFLALHKGEAKEAELHATEPDGQTLYLLVNAAPLRNTDGTISSVVSVWHDITQLKTLQHMREDFFTTMTHELKTPLANIRAHVSALLATDLEWSTREQQDFLEAADEQVERLVGMINQFLDASRIEAGSLRLALEPILLPEMLEDVRDRLEALITSSKRHLEIIAPANLPAVRADYELIMSVLVNLLSNAFRYAPEGDTVRMEAEPIFSETGQQVVGVELRVIDRGPGITPEQQAELFTRFSTFTAARRPAADRPGQSATGKRPGNRRWSPSTGLGLYISRGIIEAHGSTLTLNSSPGQGTMFAFRLPAVNTLSKEG